MPHTPVSARSLAPVWAVLLAYSALFGLLQKFVFTPLGVPEGLTLLACSVLASAVPLAWNALRPAPRPAHDRQVPRPGTVGFLFCLALTGNLAVTLLTPLLERLWKPLGLTALPPPGGDAPTFWLVFYICLAGPVLEELVYRGVVLPRLQPYGARLAILLSALCFGLMHHDLYQGLSAFWCGLVYGYAALHYGLGVSVALHIAGNSLAMVLPLLRDAGTAGAVATLLLVAVPVLVVLVGVIRRALRRRPVPPVTRGNVAGVLAQPLLWLLLAFETVYLLVASFSRI